jgi:hypothetical protein
MSNEKYDEIVDKVLDLTLGGHELDDQARGFVSRLSDFLEKDGLNVRVPEADEKVLNELHQIFVAVGSPLNTRVFEAPSGLDFASKGSCVAS